MDFVEKKKRKFGDRNDGVLVKNNNFISRVMMGLYPNRCDNEVHTTTKLDVTNILDYLSKINRENRNVNVTVFDALIYLFSRLLNERRKLNYFVSKGRLYEKDEIIISFVAKKQFDDDAEEEVLFYKANKNDTVIEVSKCVNKNINAIRQSNDAEKTLKEKKKVQKFNKLPHWLFIIVCRYLRFLNSIGRTPRYIREQDPCFSSILMANLGSVGGSAIYHHLVNYGCCSLMVNFGKLYSELTSDKNGTKTKRTFVDMSITIDERIADGFYFINSEKLLKKYIAHPEVLLMRYIDDPNF